MSFQGNAFQSDAFQSAVGASPASIDSFGWRQPLSEPVRTRVKWAAVALIASGAVGPVGFIPGDIGVASGLSQPPPRIRQFQYQSQTYVPVVAETVTVDKWFEPLSEPVRHKRDPKAALALSVASGWAGPQIPTVSFSWYRSLNEPVRVPKRLPESQQRFFEFNPFPLTPSFAWFESLSEPVRVKPRLRDGAQQAFTIDLLPRVSFSWFAELSKPTPPKAGLAARYQQSLGWVPINIEVIDYDWYQRLSEPVRKLERLHVSRQQAWIGRTFFVVPDYGWYRSWTELQMPRKRGLGAWLQQSLSWTPINITPVFNEYGWYQALSLPPPPKLGLAARFQQYTAIPVRSLPNPDISGVWDSTETKDTWRGGATFFEAPLEAIVGVIEVAFQGLSGIIESRDTGGISGLPTDPAAGSGGSAVTSIASANVSIRVI